MQGATRSRGIILPGLDSCRTSFAALPQVVATVVFVVGFWRALHTLHTNRSRARLKFRNGGKHQHPGVIVPRTFTVTHTTLLRASIGTSNNSSLLIGSRANRPSQVLVSVLPLVHSFTAPQLYNVEFPVRSRLDRKISNWSSTDPRSILLRFPTGIHGPLIHRKSPN